MEIHILIPLPEFRNVECGLVLLRISHLSPCESALHWNVDYGMWKSTFQFLSHNFGMWNVECGNPHSTIHIPKFQSTFHNPYSTILEWTMKCGFPHSIIHIPMRFSMVRAGVRYSQKDKSLFHIAEFRNWNWNVDFHIPQSTFHNQHSGISGCGM